MFGVCVDAEKTKFISFRSLWMDLMHWPGNCPESCYKIVEYADAETRKKLLLIAPFHHAVMHWRYGHGEVHGLLDDQDMYSSSSAYIQALLESNFTPTHRRYLRKLSLHLHLFEREKQFKVGLTESIAITRVEIEVVTGVLRNMIVQSVCMLSRAV